MLTDSPVAPTLPTTDLQRAKDFYTNKLGLTINKESENGVSFKAGEGTTLYVYKRGPAPSEHTLASFRVEDLEKSVDELTQKGIVFEQYDFPGLKTNERGIAIAESEGEKAAWFKDPDGNILVIGQEI